MPITYDPNGGDLGRAPYGKAVTALEMWIAVPHVANILEELAKSNFSPLPFRYAFEVAAHDRDAAVFVIHSTTYKLPPRVFWYETDGVSLFEMRGPSGGMVTSYICYLVTLK